MRILVVEDDPATGKALLQGFREAGHNCRLATDGAVALEQAMSQNADVIVLDLMLPGRSGLNLLAELRSRGVQTPVIALTALGSVEQRVAGLNAGADDYLVKPFDFAELMAGPSVSNSSSSITIFEKPFSTAPRLTCTLRIVCRSIQSR